MKNNIRQKTTALLTMAFLFVAALVSIIVVNASEHCTIRVEYQFKNGESAYDSYIAVVEKGQPVDIEITNPSLPGYKPVDSLDESTARPAPVTHIVHESLTEDITMKIYYVPDIVPYKVKYFMQNIYDDYTANLTLPEKYYDKSGLTGTFPDELKDISFNGFTRLYHKPDFIAADGSTEFELYYTRNYYLINFDLNGGYGVEPVYAKYQFPYHIAAPKREGYVFKGWVPCDKNGGFIEGGDTMAAAQRLVNALNDDVLLVTPGEFARLVSQALRLAAGVGRDHPGAGRDLRPVAGGAGLDGARRRDHDLPAGLSSLPAHRRGQRQAARGERAGADRKRLPLRL